MTCYILSIVKKMCYSSVCLCEEDHSESFEFSRKNWDSVKFYQVDNQILHTHTHTFDCLLDFVRDYPGEPVPEPIWILLEQETASGSGISWAICKSAPCLRQITMPAPTTQFFTSRMPFLQPNQQRQSTEGR